MSLRAIDHIPFIVKYDVNCEKYAYKISESNRVNAQHVLQNVNIFMFAFGNAKQCMHAMLFSNRRKEIPALNYPRVIFNGM